ncbi:MAG: RNA-binding protein [Deltaproteobacteria bacterium]|nr:RNA-binding protein [Deltaproteobacteria bacterium]
MNLYVGKLPFDVTESDLREAFSRFGHVESVKLVIDHFTKRSKGFGFVDMPDNSEADQAIKALNKSNFKGSIIKVNAADAGDNRRIERKKKKRKRF